MRKWRCWIQAMVYCSGITGSTAVFTVEGSSRSFRYSNVPLGRGTLNSDSAKPNATGVALANCASEATESIRNKLLPTREHCLSGLSGQRISLSVGIRTSVASGCHAPAIPCASMGLKRNGPKAEGPKLFWGSNVAINVVESCSTSVPLSRLRAVWKEPSWVATSIFSLRENVFGTSVFKKNDNVPSCGSSSWFFNRTAEGTAPDCTVLLMSLSLGRGGSTLV